MVGIADIFEPTSSDNKGRRSSKPQSSDAQYVIHKFSSTTRSACYFEFLVKYNSTTSMSGSAKDWPTTNFNNQNLFSMKSILMPR